MTTKKEAAREAALERRARTLALPSGKAQARLGMGKRLYCLIRRNRNGSISRYWVARFTVAGTGKVREMSLGLVDLSTLAEARRRVLDEIAKPLHAGIADPIDAAEKARKAAEEAAKGPPRFAEVFEDYIRAHRATWSNAKTLQQWQDTLPEFCRPIADKAVADITVDDVLACLEPRWDEIPVTMSRVRARIEAVLGYAMAKKLRPRGPNPATWAGNLKHLLASPTKLAKGKQRNFPALPYAQVPGLMTRLAEIEGSTVALALRFCILTAARTGEVRFARWEDVDLKAALWTRSAEQMKARREHVVPLSPQACDVLREAEKHRDGPYLFVGDVEMADGGRHSISESAMWMVLRRYHKTASVHGTARSSFKDWAVEQTSYDNALSEMALAHRVGNTVELAYRRSDQREQRRALMVDWANFIAPYAAANVVPLKRSS
jgi:integrase